MTTLSTNEDSSAVSSDTGHPIRDLATNAGSYKMVSVTLGQYLESLGLYDPATREARWDVSLLNVPFQRALIPIQKNAIKRRMLRDLLRGGTLPPTVLYHRPGVRPTALDGLQRTHTAAIAAMALAARARDEKVEDFVEEEIAAMGSLGQKPLSLDEFLVRPFIYQEWRDLQPEELVRLFIVLNAGQQKISPRHLLEVIGGNIRQMFESWGLLLLTERQEKETPRKRGRRAANDVSQAVPGNTHFRYEFLLGGLCAYVGRDPHVKTTALVLDAGDRVELSVEEKSVDERITEIGSEVCRADFVWVCRELNQLIKQKYEKVPKWVFAVQNNDNFFIPLMAALGGARTNDLAKPALDDRKAKLLEIIRQGGDDPLVLATDGSQSLNSVQATINSNIGRRQRSVVYGAFRRYFREGANSWSYPVEWRETLYD